MAHDERGGPLARLGDGLGELGGQVREEAGRPDRRLREDVEGVAVSRDGEEGVDVRGGVLGGGGDVYAVHVRVGERAHRGSFLKGGGSGGRG
ncbi:hypothetical protein V3664_22480 [Streptomyces sp. CS62]